MKILGVDVETTGLDPTACRVIEVGAVLWDTDRAAPLEIFSSLLRLPIPVPEEITAITGITAGMLREHGREPDAVFSELMVMACKADYWLAHQADFDRAFLMAEGAAAGVPWMHLPWIDTKMDLPFPRDMATRKLTYLATEHGFLNPFPHRAVFDVMTALRLFSQYPLDAVMALQRSPVVKIVAQVSFDEKEKAKSAGFHWEPERKSWCLDVKECCVEALSASFGFPFTSIKMEG